MQVIKYNLEQVNKITKLLNEIDVKGVNSVTALAMVFQELNNGTVSKVEEAGDE
jgi:hypothetical protein